MSNNNIENNIKNANKNNHKILHQNNTNDIQQNINDINHKRSRKHNNKKALKIHVIPTTNNKKFANTKQDAIPNMLLPLYPIDQTQVSICIYIYYLETMYIF